MKKTFDQLDEKTKALIMFNEWIMYTKKDDRLYKTNYFKDYENLRHWCIDIICELKNMYESIPEVNKRNQNAIFKRCKQRINFKDFKNINTYKFEIKETGGLICKKI